MRPRRPAGNACSVEAITPGTSLPSCQVCDDNVGKRCLLGKKGDSDFQMLPSERLQGPAKAASLCPLPP